MRLQELVNGNSSKLNLLSDWWAYDYDREKHWAQELEHIGLAEFPLVSKICSSTVYILQFDLAILSKQPDSQRLLFPLNILARTTS